MAPFKQAIAEKVAALAGVKAEQVIEAIEIPKKEGLADFSVCLPRLGKYTKLKGKPQDLAQQWATECQPTDLLIKASATGPYLNFDINKLKLTEVVLKRVYEQKSDWGNSTIGQGKTVIVEFSSPNIAKPFHFGHLRSTVIGNFLKNIHKALGYNVVAINYLGDWGKQYGLLAVGFKKYGSEEELLKNPIRHLYDVYVKINKDAKEEGAKGEAVHEEARVYFRAMEDGDKEALALWQKFRSLSIEEYKLLYKRLNVEFDLFSGESCFGEGMVKAVELLQEKGLLTEDRGAQLFVFPPEAKLNKVLIKKSDGSTLYITRDIASAMWRYETYKFEKMIYVVGAQQNLHFQQLFKILEMMGYDWAKKCQHVNFGMVIGMSTRSGTAVFLSDILEESKISMLEVMQKNEEKVKEVEDPEATADIVGVSAVVIQDFNARRIKDYNFNLERATTAEGDTGPYLQYAHARLSSMERKTQVKIHPDVKYELLSEKAATDLAMKIARFPDVIEASAESSEGCTLVTYLMDLCHSISSAHKELWVLGREQEVAEARMLLFWCARQTLEKGLALLGLTPLERM